jgi:hypothetical protein
MAPTSISQFEPTIQPSRHLGLIAVTIGLLLHIFAVTTITVIFHFRTKISFVGQSWHTVAQLQNENTVPVLENVSLMRDSEVEKWMEGEGIDGNEIFFIGAALVENGDRTESEEGASLRRRRL